MAVTHIIKKIQPSIFQIQIHPPNSKFQVIGTGFAIAEGYIITANHVAAALEEENVPEGTKLKVGLAAPNYDDGNIKVRAAFMLFNCEVVAVSEQNDIALLKVNQPWEELRATNQINGVDMTTRATPSKLEFDRPTEGERVAISGFPLQEPSMVTTSGIIASSWTLVDGSERYLADVTANPGNSGGPVYLVKTGEVVGVCVAGKLTNVVDFDGNTADLLHSAGLTYVVPATAIKKLLEDAGLNIDLL